MDRVEGRVDGLGESRGVQHSRELGGPSWGTLHMQVEEEDGQGLGRLTFLITLLAVVCVGGRRNRAAENQT